MSKRSSWTLCLSLEDGVSFTCVSHAENSFRSPSRFMRVNAEGTGVLIRAAFEARVQRFVYISTDEVYGDRLEQVRTS